MEYQLFINGGIYDHFRCTVCKLTFLFSKGTNPSCYKVTNHKLHAMKISTLNMYYINRLMVCENCNLLIRKETVTSGICPVCTCNNMKPLKELMNL